MPSQPQLASDVEVAPASSPVPKVTVAIVVDQLAGWVLEERMDLLDPDGGFHRLAREGASTLRASHLHAFNATAPGHAALFSCAAPHASGVVNNGRHLPDGSHQSVLDDPTARLVDRDGPTEDGAVSLALLEVPTVADQVRERFPGATIVSLSIKDRGAAFGGGRRPTASLWFDSSRSAFVTSTAFSNELPAYASPPELEAALGAMWQPLDEGWLAEATRTVDDAPGEGPFYGLTTSFPHVPTKATSAAKAFRATPLADGVVLAMARQAVLDRDPAEPMLLAISLSSTDYIGHAFGPDSWEAYEGLRVLDRQLADLLAFLDVEVGKEQVAVVLSADHGIVPTPEANPSARGDRCAKDPHERRCGGVRLLPDDVEAALREVATRTLGPGSWVDTVANPYVYLSDAAGELPTADRDRLLTALAAELEAMDGVARAVRKDPYLAAACPDGSDLSLDALLCRSTHARSGDLFVLFEPGSFFDVGYTVGQGTNHGTPYRYDRIVPLFIVAPGRVAPGETIGDTDIRTFGHAIADLMDAEPPPACAGATFQLR